MATMSVASCNDGKAGHSIERAARAEAMNGRAFKLGTFARPNGDPFAAIVLGDDVVDLARAYGIYRASAGRDALTSTDSILDLLQNWDANFPVLQEIVAFLDKEGSKPAAANLSGLRALPPVLRPGKMFYAAQNFREQVDEMPFLVPRAFVSDHTNLFIRLTVNGDVKQNGNTSQFIFTPEEQIEYASGILTLEPGDIFSCGTCGGVGQGTNTFLKAGD